MNNGKNLDLPFVIESLICDHGDKWLRFVMKMVKSREDAEDVLQEAVMRMLLRDRHFVSADQARMYLSRIICNTAIELYHLRKRNRRQMIPLQEHIFAARYTPENPGGWGDPVELNDARVLDLVQEGLARLPIKEYEALRMTIMDPAIQSIRDAGMEHDIPYSTLRHRRLQGLRHMKRFLVRALRSVRSRLLMA